MLSKGVSRIIRKDYSLQFLVFVISVTCVLFLCKAEEFARLVDPPPRGGLWRYGYSTLADLADGTVNCGGEKVQWLVNKGRCGVCGDAANGPQDHDNGGKYDEGITVRRFSPGGALNITFILSQNIKGISFVQVCPLHSSSEPLAEDCFRSNNLTNGDERFQQMHVNNNQKRNNLPQTYELHLPKDLICEHCVLRWTFLKDDLTCPSCEEKETFVNCADISITPARIAVSMPNGNRLRRVKRQLNPFGQNIFGFQPPSGGTNIERMNNINSHLSGLPQQFLGNNAGTISIHGFNQIGGNNNQQRTMPMSNFGDISPVEQIGMSGTTNSHNLPSETNNMGIQEVPNQEISSNFQGTMFQNLHNGPLMRNSWNNNQQLKRNDITSDKNDGIRSFQAQNNEFSSLNSGFNRVKTSTPSSLVQATDPYSFNFGSDFRQDISLLDSRLKEKEHKNNPSFTESEKNHDKRNFQHPSSMNTNTWKGFDMTSNTTDNRTSQSIMNNRSITLGQTGYADVPIFQRFHHNGQAQSPPVLNSGVETHIRPFNPLIFQSNAGNKQTINHPRHHIPFIGDVSLQNRNIPPNGIPPVALQTMQSPLHQLIQPNESPKLQPRVIPHKEVNSPVIHSIQKPPNQAILTEIVQPIIQPIQSPIGPIPLHEAGQTIIHTEQNPHIKPVLPKEAIVPPAVHRIHTPLNQEMVIVNQEPQSEVSGNKVRIAHTAPQVKQPQIHLQSQMKPQALLQSNLNAKNNLPEPMNMHGHNIMFHNFHQKSFSHATVMMPDHIKQISNSQSFSQNIQQDLTNNAQSRSESFHNVDKNTVNVPQNQLVHDNTEISSQKRSSTGAIIPSIHSPVKKNFRRENHFRKINSLNGETLSDKTLSLRTGPNHNPVPQENVLSVNTPTETIANIQNVDILPLPNIALSPERRRPLFQEHPQTIGNVNIGLPTETSKKPLPFIPNELNYARQNVMTPERNIPNKEWHHKLSINTLPNADKANNGQTFQQSQSGTNNGNNVQNELGVNLQNKGIHSVELTQAISLPENQFPSVSHQDNIPNELKHFSPVLHKNILSGQQPSETIVNSQNTDILPIRSIVLSPENRHSPFQEHSHTIREVNRGVIQPTGMSKKPVSFIPNELNYARQNIVTPQQIIPYPELHQQFSIDTLPDVNKKSFRQPIERSKNGQNIVNNEQNDPEIHLRNNRVPSIELTQAIALQESQFPSIPQEKIPSELNYFKKLNHSKKETKKPESSLMVDTITESRIVQQHSPTTNKNKKGKLSIPPEGQLSQLAKANQKHIFREEMPPFITSKSSQGLPLLQRISEGKITVETIGNAAAETSQRTFLRDSAENADRQFPQSHHLLILYNMNPLFGNETKDRNFSDTKAVHNSQRKVRVNKVDHGIQQSAFTEKQFETKNIPNEKNVQNDVFRGLSQLLGKSDSDFQNTKTDFLGIKNVSSLPFTKLDVYSKQSTSRLLQENNMANNTSENSTTDNPKIIVQSIDKQLHDQHMTSDITHSAGLSKLFDQTGNNEKRTNSIDTRYNKDPGQRSRPPNSRNSDAIWQNEQNQSINKSEISMSNSIATGNNQPQLASNVFQIKPYNHKEISEIQLFSSKGSTQDREIQTKKGTEEILSSKRNFSEKISYPGNQLSQSSVLKSGRADSSTNLFSFENVFEPATDVIPTTVIPTFETSSLQTSGFQSYGNRKDERKGQKTKTQIFEKTKQKTYKKPDSKIINDKFISSDSNPFPITSKDTSENRRFERNDKFLTGNLGLSVAGHQAAINRENSVQLVDTTGKTHKTQTNTQETIIFQTTGDPPSQPVTKEIRKATQKDRIVELILNGKPDGELSRHHDASRKLKAGEILNNGEMKDAETIEKGLSNHNQLQNLDNLNTKEETNSLSSKNFRNIGSLTQENKEKFREEKMKNTSDTTKEPPIVENVIDNIKRPESERKLISIVDLTNNNITSKALLPNDTAPVGEKVKLVSVIDIADVETVKAMKHDENVNPNVDPNIVSKIPISSDLLQSSFGGPTSQVTILKSDAVLATDMTSEQYKNPDKHESLTTSADIFLQNGNHNDSKHGVENTTASSPQQSGMSSLFDKIIAFQFDKNNRSNSISGRKSGTAQNRTSETRYSNDTDVSISSKHGSSSGQINNGPKIITTAKSTMETATTSPGNSLLDLIIAFEKTVVSNKSKDLHLESGDTIHLNSSLSKSNEVPNVEFNSTRTKEKEQANSSHKDILGTSHLELNENKSISSSSEIWDQSMLHNDKIIAFNMLNGGGMIPLQEVIVGEVKRERIQGKDNIVYMQDKYALGNKSSSTKSVNSRLKRSLMNRAFQLSVSAPQRQSDVRKKINSVPKRQNGMRGIQLTVSASQPPQKQSSLKSRIFSSEILNSIMNTPSTNQSSLSSPPRGKIPLEQAKEKQRPSVTLWTTSFRSFLPTLEPRATNSVDTFPATLSSNLNKEMTQSTRFLPANGPEIKSLTPDPEVLKRIQSQKFVILNGLSLGSISFNDFSKHLQYLDQLSTTKKETISTLMTGTTPAIMREVSTNRNTSKQSPLSTTEKAAKPIIQKNTTPSAIGEGETNKSLSSYNPSSNPSSNSDNTTEPTTHTFSSAMGEASTDKKPFHQHQEQHNSTEKTTKVTSSKTTASSTIEQVSSGIKEEVVTLLESTSTVIPVRQRPPSTAKISFNSTIDIKSTTSEKTKNEPSTPADLFSIIPTAGQNIFNDNISFHPDIEATDQNVIQTKSSENIKQSERFNSKSTTLLPSPTSGARSVVTFPKLTTIAESDPESWYSELERRLKEHNHYVVSNLGLFLPPPSTAQPTTQHYISKHTPTSSHRLKVIPVTEADKIITQRAQPFVPPSFDFVDVSAGLSNILGNNSLLSYAISETELPNLPDQSLHAPKIKSSDIESVSNVQTTTLTKPTKQNELKSIIGSFDSTSETNFNKSIESSNQDVQNSFTKVVETSASNFQSTSTITTLLPPLSRTTSSDVYDYTANLINSTEKTHIPASPSQDYLSSAMEERIVPNENPSVNEAAELKQNTDSKLVASNHKSTVNVTAELKQFTDSSLVVSNENLIFNDTAELNQISDRNLIVSSEYTTLNNTTEVTQVSTSNQNISLEISFSSNKTGRSKLNEMIAKTPLTTDNSSMAFETTTNPLSINTQSELDPSLGRYEHIPQGKIESTTRSVSTTGKQIVNPNDRKQSTPESNKTEFDQYVTSTESNDAFRQSERIVTKQSVRSPTSTKLPVISTYSDKELSSLSEEIRESITGIITTIDMPTTKSSSVIVYGDEDINDFKTQGDATITNKAGTDMAKTSLRNDQTYPIIKNDVLQSTSKLKYSVPSSVTKDPKLYESNLSIEKFLTPNPKITIHNFGVGRTKGPTFDYVALSTALGYMNKNLEDLKTIPYDTEENEISQNDKKKILWTSDIQGDPLVLNAKISQYENMKNNQKRPEFKVNLNSSERKSGIPILLSESKIEMIEENRTGNYGQSFLKEDIWKRQKPNTKSNQVTPTKIPTPIPYFSTSMSGLDLSNSLFTDKDNKKEVPGEKALLDKLHNDEEYKDPLTEDFSLYGNFTKMLLNNDLNIKDISGSHEPEKNVTSENKADRSTHEEGIINAAERYTEKMDSPVMHGMISPTIAKSTHYNMIDTNKNNETEDSQLDTTTNFDYTSKTMLNQNVTTTTSNALHQGVSETFLESSSIQYDISQQDESSQPQSLSTEQIHLFKTNQYSPQGLTSTITRVNEAIKPDKTSAPTPYSYTKSTEKPIWQTSVISSVEYTTIMPDITSFPVPMTDIKSISTIPTLIPKKSTPFISEVPNNYLAFSDMNLANEQSTLNNIQNTSPFITTTVKGAKSSVSTSAISTASNFSDYHESSTSFPLTTSTVMVTPKTMTPFSNEISSKQVQSTTLISLTTMTDNRFRLKENPEQTSSIPTSFSMTKSVLEKSSLLPANDYVSTTPSFKPTGELHSSYPITDKYEGIVSTYTDSNDTKTNILSLDKNLTREINKHSTVYDSFRSIVSSNRLTTKTFQNLSDFNVGVKLELNTMNNQHGRGNSTKKLKSVLIRKLIEDAKLTSFIARNKDEMRNLKQIMVGTSTEYPVNTVSNNFGTYSGGNAHVQDQKLDSRIRFFDDAFTLDSFIKNEDTSTSLTTESYAKSPRFFTTDTKYNEHSSHMHKRHTAEVTTDNAIIPSTLQSHEDNDQLTQSTTTSFTVPRDAAHEGEHKTIDITRPSSDLNLQKSMESTFQMPNVSRGALPVTSAELNRDETATLDYTIKQSSRKTYSVNENGQKHGSSINTSNNKIGTQNNIFVTYRTDEQTGEERAITPFTKKQFGGIFEITTMSTEFKGNDDLSTVTNTGTLSSRTNESESSKYFKFPKAMEEKSVGNVTTSKLGQDYKIRFNSTTALFGSKGKTSSLLTTTSSTVSTGLDNVTDTTTQSSITTTSDNIDKVLFDHRQRVSQISQHAAVNNNNTSTTYSTKEIKNIQELKLMLHNPDNELSPYDMTNSSYLDSEGNSSTSATSTIDRFSTDYAITNNPSVHFKNSDDAILKTTEAYHNDTKPNFNKFHEIVTTETTQSSKYTMMDSTSNSPSVLHDGQNKLYETNNIVSLQFEDRENLPSLNTSKTFTTVSDIPSSTPSFLQKHSTENTPSIDTHSHQGIDKFESYQMPISFAINDRTSFPTDTYLNDVTSTTDGSPSTSTISIPISSTRVSTSTADYTIHSSSPANEESIKQTDTSTLSQSDTGIHETNNNDKHTTSSYSTQYNLDIDLTTKVQSSTEGVMTTVNNTVTDLPSFLRSTKNNYTHNVSAQNESTKLVQLSTEKSTTTSSDIPIISTTSSLTETGSHSDSTDAFQIISEMETNKNVGSSKDSIMSTNKFRQKNYPSVFQRNLIHKSSTFSPIKSNIITTTMSPTTTSITTIMRSLGGLSVVPRELSPNNKRHSVSPHFEPAKESTVFFSPTTDRNSVPHQFEIPKESSVFFTATTERNLEFTRDSPSTDASIVNEGRTQFSMASFLQRGSSHINDFKIKTDGAFTQQLPEKETTTMSTLSRTDAVKFTLGMNHVKKNLATFFKTKPDVYTVPSESPLTERLSPSQPLKPTMIPKRRVTGLPLFSSNIITQLPYYFPSTIQKKFGNGKTLNINVRLIPKELVNEEIDPSNYTSINESFIERKPIENVNKNISFSGEHNSSLSIEIGSLNDSLINSTQNDHFYELSKNLVMEPLTSTKVAESPSLSEFQYSVSPLIKIRSTRLPELIFSTTEAAQPISKSDIKHKIHPASSSRQTLIPIVDILSSPKPLQEQSEVDVSTQQNKETTSILQNRTTTITSEYNSTKILPMDKTYATPKYPMLTVTMPLTSKDLQNVDASPSVHMPSPTKSFFNGSTSESPVDTKVGDSFHTTGIPPTFISPSNRVSIRGLDSGLKSSNNAWNPFPGERMSPSSSKPSMELNMNMSPASQKSVNTLNSRRTTLISKEQDNFNGIRNTITSIDKVPKRNMPIKSESKKTSILLAPSKDSPKGQFAFSAWNDNQEQALDQNFKLSRNSLSQSLSGQKARPLESINDFHETRRALSGKLSPLLSPDGGWYNGVFVDTVAPSFNDGTVGSLSVSLSNPSQTIHGLRSAKGHVAETEHMKKVDNTRSASSNSTSRVIWHSHGASSSLDKKKQSIFIDSSATQNQVTSIKRKDGLINESSKSQPQVVWQPNAVPPLLGRKIKEYFVDYQYPVVRPSDRQANDNKLSLLSGVPIDAKNSDLGISFGDNVMSGSLSQLTPKSKRHSVQDTPSAQNVDRTQHSAVVSKHGVSGHMPFHTAGGLNSRHVRSTSTQSIYKKEISNLSQNYLLDAQKLCREKEVFTCFGKGSYSKFPGMKWWCVQNCRHGNCPMSKCRCGCQINGSENLRNVQLLLGQRQVERNVFPVSTTPSSTRRSVWNCTPTSAYSPVKGLGEWCNVMCSLNACPLNMCDCT